MQTQQPAAPPAPTFIRTLARVAGLPMGADGEGLLEPVAQWLDWNRAVALSRVLDAPMAAVSGPASLPETLAAGKLAAGGLAAGRLAVGRLAAGRLAAGRLAAGRLDAAAVERQRLALRQEIEDDAAWPALRASEPSTEIDFAPLRAHYSALQRKMQAVCGRLRGELREQLLHAAPAQARLVALDALMEGLLSPREQGVLAAIPELLGRRHAHLQAQAAAADLAAPGASTRAWQQAFRADLRGLLLAELELRFLPVDALQAALQ